MYGLFKMSTVYWQCFCSPFVIKINVTICSLFVGVFWSNDLYRYQARDAATKKLIADHGPHAYLIPSSDHPHIIAGQGSIAVEFLEQVASFFIYLYTLLELNFAFLGIVKKIAKFKTRENKSSRNNTHIEISNRG